MSRRELTRRLTFLLLAVMLVPMAGLYWVGLVDDGQVSAAQRLRRGEMGGSATGSAVERTQQEVRRRLAIAWGISLLACGAGVMVMRHLLLHGDASRE